MITIHIIDANTRGNLYNNPNNQIRRAIGPFNVVYCGGVRGGTVRSLEDGRSYDWWPTEEKIEGNWCKIEIVPAM